MTYRIAMPVVVLATAVLGGARLAAGQATSTGAQTPTSRAAQTSKSAVEQTPSKAAKNPSASDNYDELFDKFLKEAREVPPPAPGDNWAWMNGLALDNRARRVNDLVTIQVVENITAAGSADASVQKDSSASVGLPSLFGLESKLPGDPASLVSGKSNTDFKGTGSTTRQGQLTALVTARVTEVLPSGDLVVEGVREMVINGDRQIVVLTGVVRQADIAPANVVPSTSIGQFRIRYFGRGLMKDNLNPGWLVRILNKVF
jgi:flagellar L-ring protein precursor FlgH